MQAFKKAIDFKPNYLTYLSRGVVRTNLKDYQGGIADLNEAIRLQPDDARTYSSRCYARSLLKDVTGAIASASLRKAAASGRSRSCTHWVQLMVNSTTVKLAIAQKQQQSRSRSYDQAMCLQVDSTNSLNLIFV